MPYYREDEPVIVRESGSGVATNLIWAITTLAVVGLIVWTIFYSNIFRPQKLVPSKVDINVSAPANR